MHYFSPEFGLEFMLWSCSFYNDEMKLFKLCNQHNLLKSQQKFLYLIFNMAFLLCLHRIRNFWPTVF